MRTTLIALAALVACAFTGTAEAATLHATPANFASTYAGAAGGDTILLASGSYGAFNGGAKSSMVTIDEESGASASFSSSDFGTSVRNLTVRNVTYTGTICITAPSTAKMNVVLDGITIGDVGQGCNEGRIGLKGGSDSIGGAGVQIKNSKIGPGGCSDGIQDSMHGAEIGPGNELFGMTQSCGAAEAHVDPIQPYDGDFAWIHDNWIHGNEQGIMSPDGLSTGYLFENNVIDMALTGYYCMHIGDSRNGTIRHNVCVNGGGIRLYGGNQGVASQNMTVQDNASPVDNISCTNCTVDHNSTAVTFTGGTGRCGYATASPKGTASDGTDIGLNDCGSSPPPTAACSDGLDNDSDGFIDYPADVGCSSATDTDESDPLVDHTPVAAFTDSPAPSYQGETVTFNASSSTCDDTPCTYHWHDTGPQVNGSCAGTTGDWPVGSDGVTTTQAFSGTGVKCVELVLTDADGDVAKVEHDHTVLAGSRPSQDTTAPNTSLTSATTTATTVSLQFTGTDNVGVASYQCKLDSAAYAACSSPKSYTGLSAGVQHVVKVRAVDAAGNVDASPVSYTWTLVT